MTKAQFKKRWDSNEDGGGITFDDIAQCAIDRAFSDAVNDAQDYDNPNVAQDALQDAYDNVRSWIYEILNGGEDGDSE